MTEWDEVERRKPGMAERSIWEELRKINTQLAVYQAERDELRPKVEEVLEILTVSKGLLAVIRAIVFIATPIAAIIYWLKEHVK